MTPGRITICLFLTWCVCLTMFWNTLFTMLRLSCIVQYTVHNVSVRLVWVQWAFTHTFNGITCLLKVPLRKARILQCLSVLKRRQFVLANNSLKSGANALMALVLECGMLICLLSLLMLLLALFAAILAPVLSLIVLMHLHKKLNRELVFLKMNTWNQSFRI